MPHICTFEYLHAYKAYQSKIREYPSGVDVNLHFCGCRASCYLKGYSLSPCWSDLRVIIATLWTRTLEVTKRSPNQPNQ
jgi:hypothetical protein